MKKGIKVITYKGEDFYVKKNGQVTQAGKSGGHIDEDMFKRLIKLSDAKKDRTHIKFPNQKIAIEAIEEAGGKYHAPLSASESKVNSKGTLQKSQGGTTRKVIKTKTGKKWSENIDGTEDIPEMISPKTRKTPPKKGRKAPKESALIFDVGTIKEGLDGNMHIVKLVKRNGKNVKDWKPTTDADLSEFVASNSFLN